ncbi:MAG: Nif3-like dinuclear metal center hexameric protein [Neisseriaceae bacterium]
MSKCERPNKVQCQQLLDYMNELLKVQMFYDYCPVGLQVEGTPDICKIVTAVSASLRAINYATEIKADLLLTHHGMFWKKEPPGIIGWKKNRIKTLLMADLNLISYHLALDVHPELGNNISLAKKLGWNYRTSIGEQGLLCLGSLPNPVALKDLAKLLALQLQRQPLVLGPQNKVVQNIAWCTGAGQEFFMQAIEEKVDAFITGEVSEAQFHLANESQVGFIAAGHHATERYGIKALGEHLHTHWGLEVYFFDDLNPV